MDDRPPIIIRYQNKKVEKEIVVPHCPLTVDFFKNQHINAFGTTGSGKTIIFLHYLKIMKDFFEFASLTSMSQADADNNCNTYEKFLPAVAIRDTFDLNFLESTLENQKVKTDIYRQSRDMKSLEELYGLIITKNYDEKIEKLKRDLALTMNQISPDDDDAINRATEFTNSMLRKIYSKAIKENKLALEKQIRNIRDTGKQENLLVCLKGQEITNPEIGLFFDDCGPRLSAILKEATKLNNTAIQRIYTEGRKSHISSFWMFQDHRQVPAALRSYSTINIFTNSHQCMHYAKMETSGFTPEQ